MLPGKTFLFLALYILVSLAASDENAELDAIVEKLASSSSLLSGISLQNGLIDGSINPDHAIAAMMGMETVDMGKLEKFDGGTIMDYFKTLRDVAPDYSQVEDVPRQLAMILREYEQVEALQTARVKRIAIGDLTSAAKSVGNVLDTSPFNALGQTVGGAVGLFNDIRNFPNTSLSGVAGNAADTLKGLHGALTGVTNLASGVSKAIDDLKKLPGFGLIWKGLAMTPKGRLLITAKKLFDKINLLKNMIPTDFNDFVDKMKNLPNFFKDLIPEEFSDVMSVFNCVTDWMSPFNSDKIKCEKKKSENQNQNQNQDPNNNNNNNSPSPSSSPSSSPSNPLSNPIGSIDNAVKKAKEALRDAIRPDSSPSKGKNMDKADRIQKNLRNWSPSPSGSGSGGGGGGGSGGGGGLPIPGIPLPSASIPFSTGIPGIGLGGGGGGGSGGGGGGGGGGGSGGSGGGGSGGSSGGSGGSSGSGIGVDLPSLPGLGDLDNIFSALFNLIPTGLLTGPNPLGAAIKGIDAASKVADGLSSVLPNVPGVTAAITGLFPNLPIGGVVDPSHLAGPLKDLLDALPSPADVDQMTPKQVEDAIMNIKTLPAFIPVAEKIDELEAPLDVIVDGLDRADLRVNLGILADPAEKVKMENFDSDGAVKTYFTTLKDSADGIKKALAAVDLIGELRDLKDDDQFFKDILAVGSGIKEATKEIKKTRDTVSTIVKNADKIPSDVKFDGLKNIQPDSRAVSDAVEVVKGVVKAAKGKEHIETLIKEGGKVATAIEKIPDPVVKAEVKKLWGDFDKTKTALNKFKDQVDEKKKEIVKAAKENPMFDSTLDPSKKSTLPQRPSGNRATPPNGLNPPPNPTNPANPPVNPSDSTSTTAASNPSGPVTNPTSRPDVINPVGPADSSSTTSSQVVTSNTNPADSSTPDHTLVNPTNPPASQNPSGSPDVPSLPNPSNPWDADIHIPTGPPITDAIPANLADLGDIFTKAIGIQPVDINFADRAKALGLLITHLPPVNVSFPSADAFDIENVLRSLENVNDINPGTFGGADGLLSSIPAILDKVDTSVKGVQQEAEGSEELKRWREEVKERMTPEQRERERKMEEERESRRKDHLYFVKKSLRFREMWMVSEPREAESMERSMCRIVKEKSKEGNGLVTVASYKMGPPEKMEKRSDTGFDLVFEGCQWIRLWISSNKNMSAYTLEQNVENSLDFNFHLNWFSDGERIDGILENVYRVRFVFPRNETMKPQLEFHRKNSTISDRHVLNLPVDYTRHWFHLIKAPYCVADFKAPSIYDEVEKATNDKRTEKEMLEESLHSVKPWVDPLVPQRCSLGSFVPIGAPIEEKVS